MNQTSTFNIAVANNIIVAIGKSTVYQPPVKFGSGTIKWFDDTKLIKKKE